MSAIFRALRHIFRDLITLLANIWCAVRAMTLHIMQFSPASCHFLHVIQVRSPALPSQVINVCCVILSFWAMSIVQIIKLQQFGSQILGRSEAKLNKGTQQICFQFSCPVFS
jgi:hypothetical protein